MVIVLAWEWQLQRLRDQGLVVECGQCQHATELDGSRLTESSGSRLARCPIACSSVELNRPLICTDFKERTSA